MLDDLDGGHREDIVMRGDHIIHFFYPRLELSSVLNQQMNSSSCYHDRQHDEIVLARIDDSML